MLFPSRLREVVRQVIGVNPRRRSVTRRRPSQAECLEPRLVLTVSSYVPAYVLEAPLEGVVSASAYPYNFPTFGDVDADGDLDLLMGQFGELTYFKNIGTSTTPNFEEQSVANNPFAEVVAAIVQQVGSNAIILPNPTLADWDADGDLDLAVGLQSRILAFRNIGTTAMPNFDSLTGDANPFAQDFMDSIRVLAITFGDLDGDFDLDAVVSSGDDRITGSFQNRLNYLENRDGLFVALSENASENPFGQISVNPGSSPELGDFDGDGDVDLAVSTNNPILGLAHLDFFENTSTTTLASFERLFAVNNIGQLDLAQYYAPAFGDLDHDGDQDLLVAMIGSPNGPFQYFEAAGDPLNAPTNGLASNLTMVEDTAFLFSSAGYLVSVADANAGDSPLEITLVASHGTLTLATTLGLAFSAGDGFTDAVLTFRGRLSDINAALEVGLTFVPDLNFSGEASITMTTNDLGQPDGGEALFDNDTARIRVLSVSEAITELRQYINDSILYGEFTAGQGAALLRNLELTGDYRTDARSLQTYVRISTGMLTGRNFTPEFRAVFLKFGEDILTGLLTN